MDENLVPISEVLGVDPAELPVRADELPKVSPEAQQALTQLANLYEPKLEWGEEIDPTSPTLYTLGYVAVLFQLPVQTVRRLMRAAGVTFSAVIDEVPHIDQMGLLRMNHHLRRLKKQAANASQQ